MMLSQSKFSKKAKLLKQTSIIHLIFLIILFNISALNTDVQSNTSPSHQSSNYSNSSGMVKVGLTDIPGKENFSLEYFIKEKAYLEFLERDILPYLRQKTVKPPTCFISYAWGDRYHEYWVKRFSEMLDKAGIQVFLDMWTIKNGNILSEFSKKIGEADWVIVVGTKLYLEKYNRQAAGPKEKEDVARLEGQLIEHLVRYNTERGNRVIPILLEGTSEECLPFMLHHKIAVEFTKNDYFEELLKLIRDLYNIDNRDKHFEGLVEKFRRYAIAAAVNTTQEERKAYEKKRTEEILELDKEISKKIDLYKEKAFKPREELEEVDYSGTTLTLQSGAILPKFHSYIVQAKLKDYVAREDKQQELNRKLKVEGVCVISGHGGIGKSTLAAQYGYELKDKPIVWWMEAQTAEKLITSYEKLARELGINYQLLAQELKKDIIKYLEELSRKIYNTLEDCQQPALLILDNAMDPKLIGACLLHRSSLIQVIITTRDSVDFKNYNQVKLGPFTKEAGTIYIKKRLQDIQPSEKDIDNLISIVGLIPQRLALATGYISEVRFMNVEKYIKKLQELKGQVKKKGGKLVLPEVNVGLETLGLTSQLLMRYGAYLDSDFIPFSLIAALLGISDEEELDPVLAVLERLSLITIVNASTRQGIRIHREIQTVCKDYQGWKEGNKITEQALIKELIQVLCQYMPKVTDIPDNNWEQARLYASNVSSILKVAANKEIVHPLLASLLDRMGSYNQKIQCNYEQALRHHEQALEMRKSIHIDNHSDIANSLHEIGLVYENSSRYQEALKYYEQALEMRKNLYKGKVDHPDIAYSLNSLGKVYRVLGGSKKEKEKTLNHLQESLKYVKQALEMRKNLYKDKINHPDVASSLNSLGKVYRVLGQYQEALKYITQALEMRKTIHRGNHPDIAYSLDSLGKVYSVLHQYQEALNCYKQALEMRKTIHTGNYPHIAYSLHSLGIVYQALAQHQEALHYYEEALKIYQAVYPKNHRYIAMLLDNLGSVHQGLGQYQEAKKYYERALEMYQALYIDTHPQIAESLDNLGSVYRKLGQSAEALKCYQQALEMRKRLYPSNHPDIANSLNNLKELY